MLSVLAIGGFFFYLKKEPGAIDSAKLNHLLRRLQKVDLPGVIEQERVWTDETGRELTGTLVAGSDTTALVRTVPAQHIYRIPLSRLSEEDRSYVRKRAKSSAEFDQIYPKVAKNWPQLVEGRRQPLNLKRDPDGIHWTTTSYIFKPDREIDEELARNLATTCEAVDVALMKSPLPLLWGRDREKKRVIKIYTSEADFMASGSQKNWGAYYVPVTNEVHVPLSSLTGTGNTPAYSQFNLRKRDDYKILVHELVHQATVSFLVLGIPAWIGEGTAEIFSAMQTQPGQFNFQNHRTQIREYLNQQIDTEGLVQFKSLPLPRLENFLELDLRGFNRTTSASSDGGFCEYAASMILMEYFCFADGNSMKPYLEAVFSGLTPDKAAEAHLLRDRSPQELENLIIARWKEMGIDLYFTNKPKLQVEDIRRGLGG